MTKKTRKQSDKSRSQATQPDGQPSRFLHELRSLGIIVLIALALRATVVEAYIVPTGSMEKTIMIGDFLIGNKFIYGMRTPDWLGIPYTRLGFSIPWLRFPAFRQPRSGDVVIFKYPHDPQDKYVKRLIAGPGQTVEIREREILVAGESFYHPEHLQFLERKSQPEDWIDPNIFPRGNGNKDHYGLLRVPSEGDTLSAAHDQVVLWYVARMDGHTPHLVRNQIFLDDQPITQYVVEQDYYFMMGDNRDQSYDSRFWGFVPHDHILGEALFVYFSLDFKRFPYITWNRLKRIGSVIH
ncbi:MAG: signal peptidase I [Fidelibacterota bacterium]|nr:MAG: signal peptidase I [Candidatus Neomarinimicrobiota bacterium]